MYSKVYNCISWKNMPHSIDGASTHLPTLHYATSDHTHCHHRHWLQAIPAFAATLPHQDYVTLHSSQDHSQQPQVHTHCGKRPKDNLPDQAISYQGRPSVYRSWPIGGGGSDAGRRRFGSLHCAGIESQNGLELERGNTISSWVEASPGLRWKRTFCA